MLTETENRILIDEQLCKVGWELDISKGTRLTSGRNIGTALTAENIQRHLKLHCLGYIYIKISL